MTRYLLRFDEINRLIGEFEGDYEELASLLYEEMKNAYISAYGDGYDDMLIEQLIMMSYDGKDVFDLLEEAFIDNDWVRVETIFSNEYHRMYNAGAYDYGKEHYKTKTWVTMGDDKVRDTHSYLEGITVPVDAEFITYDGDSADYPGGFSNASNNVNCRCVLEYK